MALRPLLPDPPVHRLKLRRPRRDRREAQLNGAGFLVQLDLALWPGTNPNFRVYTLPQKVAVAVYTGAYSLAGRGCHCSLAWESLGFHQGPQKRFFQHAAAVAGVAACARFDRARDHRATGSFQQGITHQRLRASMIGSPARSIPACRQSRYSRPNNTTQITSTKCQYNSAAALKWSEVKAQVSAWNQRSGSSGFPGSRAGREIQSGHRRCWRRGCRRG